MTDFMTMDELNRLRKRVAELEEALRFAISVIGHPDDAGTEYLKSVSNSSAVPTS